MIRFLETRLQVPYRAKEWRVLQKEKKKWSEGHRLNFSVINKGNKLPTYLKTDRPWKQTFIEVVHDSRSHQTGAHLQNTLRKKQWKATQSKKSTAIAEHLQRKDLDVMSKNIIQYCG